MWNQILPALRITVVLTVLTGVIYPGVVTPICQLLFPHQANGSLIVRDGKVIGSALLGQNFSKPEYVHPRPSSAGNEGYDAANSSGSNLGPTSKKLADRVKASVDAFRKENPDFTGPIPADLLTSSGSGLDPHLSIASVEAQAARIAKARGVGTDQIHELITQSTESRDLGFLGEPRVNVLGFNMLLDERLPIRK